MTWTADDLPDLTGRTAVVTGATGGLGRHTAAALARHGARVVLACRDTAAGERVAAGIDGATAVERLDLASLASVQAFAERVDGPLHLLVNNAGVMTPPRYRETDDGFELQMGTNHLGHVALTARLLPQLLADGRGRVVTVSSIAHHRGDASVLDGNPPASYRAAKAYGNSKLANLLFGRELQRRAREAGAPLDSTMAHPGVSATELVSDPHGLGALPLVGRLAPYVLPLVLQSAEAGARATLFAATDAAPGSYTGPQRLRETRGPIGSAKLSRWARDDELAVALWEQSLEQTGVTFDL